MWIRHAFIFCLLTTACGSSELTGSGMADVTIHQAGTADVKPDVWFLDDQNPIRAQPGTGTNQFGTCTHTSSTWTADINRTGVASGISAFHVVVADEAAIATVDATVDGASFSGTCTLAPAHAWADTHDLALAAQCTGLTLDGDPRTVDLDLTVGIENCTGSP